MLMMDTIDKIVRSYFAVVNAETFTYKGVDYEPKPLRISEGLFRGYTCPARCGGCCFRFSLDYLPKEKRPYPLRKRLVPFNGHEVEIWSDLQDGYHGHFCHNLNLADGRCNIHGSHPFSCDFELIRAAITQNEEKPNRLTTRLYGHGWAYKRVDGGKGALCEITPITLETCNDVLRKFYRLEEWADHFHLKTRLEEIINWIEQGPHNEPGYF